MRMYEYDSSYKNFLKQVINYSIIIEGGNKCMMCRLFLGLLKVRFGIRVQQVHAQDDHISITLGTIKTINEYCNSPESRILSSKSGRVKNFQAFSVTKYLCVQQLNRKHSDVN